MRLLLVEPYHSGAHRAWAEGYAASSTHEVRMVPIRDGGGSGECAVAQ